MSIFLMIRLTAVIVLSSVMLIACGGDDSDPTAPTSTGDPAIVGTEIPATSQDEATTPTGDSPAGQTPADGGTVPAGETSGVPAGPTGETNPAPSDPAPESGARLTPEQLQELKPNELGWIPVLQYHHFDPVPDELTRTPEQFRGDLQWLYDNNFYVVNVRDYINDRLNVPAGKRAVMLTFDDSAVSQFSIRTGPDGQYMVDPDSAIAIMESFFAANPDFGRGGHFAILADRPFSWPDAWDQQELAGMKLEWLVSNGYELGNHTIDHANLALIDTAEIQYQLVEAERVTQKYIPDARLEIVTLPYGGYPGGGDDTVFHGFHYEGDYYEYGAVLLVGSNPAVSVLSTDYHPFWIPRIQAFDEELGRWMDFIDENPGIMYVSDGNPDTVTIPHDLPWALLDTLDESRLGDRELIRY
jgi:peptidoglycan/xylan/chitin deacetylase (PgdA/CDA1 family)